MGKKILVVDNDQFMLTFMEDLLTEHGHEVLAASDGLSALEILKEYVPDIIFVDRIMPNISGDKLCRIIRSTPRLQHTYLAVVSATVAEEPTHFADLGADTAIAKGPLDQMSATVLEAVNQTGQTSLRSLEETVQQAPGTHQRRITRELLSVQRHLQTILSNISKGVLELNIEGKVIFANNIALSLFGGFETNVLGHLFTDLFDESNQKKIQDLLAEIGSGRPEITDPFVVRLNHNTISLKILPVEDNLAWSVIVIAVPLNRNATRP